MGLFSETINNVNLFLESKKAMGQVRRYEVGPAAWPNERSLILKADTGIELGNPLQSSLSLLVWAEPEPGTGGDDLLLVGPDLPESISESMPFARLLIVRGDFTDEYESYGALLEATYDLHLTGVTSRSLPSRQEIWLRISRDALQKGINLVVIGNALIERIKKVESVQTVQIVYVTSSREDVASLAPTAERAMAILDALVKMYDEMDFDCDTCEYEEVCDEVTELRTIRERLRGAADV